MFPYHPASGCSPFLPGIQITDPVFPGNPEGIYQSFLQPVIPAAQAFRGSSSSRHGSPRSPSPRRRHSRLSSRDEARGRQPRYPSPRRLHSHASRSSRDETSGRPPRRSPSPAAGETGKATRSPGKGENAVSCGRDSPPVSVSEEPPLKHFSEDFIAHLRGESLASTSGAIADNSKDGANDNISEQDDDCARSRNESVSSFQSLHLSADDKDEKSEEKVLKKKKRTFQDFKADVFTNKLRGGRDIISEDVKPSRSKGLTKNKRGRPKGATNKTANKKVILEENKKLRAENADLKDDEPEGAITLLSSDDDGESGAAIKESSANTPRGPTIDVDDVKSKLKSSNIEDRFVEAICLEVLASQTDPVTWDDVSGLEKVKSSIHESVVLPTIRPDLFTGLRRAPKGILLYGPPGTGKTMMAKCIASQCRTQFINISSASLTSKWFGDGEKMIRALFAVAKEIQPTVIFIDEVDSLLSQRSKNEHECVRKMKTELLVQMDGALTRPEDKILVIGATNRPEELDDAARRRFTRRLLVPLPDLSARVELLQRQLKQNMNAISLDDIVDISIELERYSAADIMSLLQYAAMAPLREYSSKQLETINAKKLRPINSKDLKDAMQNVRPSVSEEDVTKFETFRF